MNRLARIFSAIGFVLASAVGAQAGVIYQSGFESPTYTPAALPGQGGWGGSIGTVQTGVVKSGTQAVAFNSTGLLGQFVPQHATPFTPGGHQGSLVHASIDVFISTVDPLVYWEILGFIGNSGFLTQLVMNNDSTIKFGGTTSFVEMGVWNQFAMDIDFATQTVAAYLNGALIGSENFASANTGLKSVGIGVNTAKAGTSSLAYFDNLSIAANDVPEPGSLALLGLGLVGVAVARKRKPV